MALMLNMRHWLAEHQQLHLLDLVEQPLPKHFQLTGQNNCGIGLTTHMAKLVRQAC